MQSPVDDSANFKSSAKVESQIKKFCSVTLGLVHHLSQSNVSKVFLLPNYTFNRSTFPITTVCFTHYSFHSCSCTVISLEMLGLDVKNVFVKCNTGFCRIIQYQWCVCQLHCCSLLICVKWTIVLQKVVPIPLAYNDFKYNWLYSVIMGNVAGFL